MRFYSFTVLISIILMPPPVTAETNQIDITLRHSNYPYHCYAIGCFNTNAEREGRLKNAKKVADNSCRSFSSETCEKDKEYFAAMNQCENSYCLKAKCRTTDLNSGRCISGAYFR